MAWIDKRMLHQSLGVSGLCNCAASNLTGSVFLGSFRVLEGAEESLAEIHREVLHFQIRLQE